MTPLERDLEPGQPWTFDGPVAREFDAMLRRSIPDLDRMRALTYLIGREFVRDECAVVDLGAARGDALAPFLSYERDGRGRRFVAVEKSPAMLDVLRDRFQTEDVYVSDHDLRTGVPPLSSYQASLFLAILTVQFVPVDYRHRLLKSAHEALVPGGALIVVEKTLPTSGILDDVFRKLYWRTKHDEGYTDEEIVRKAAALEGVLVPLPADWTVDALKRAGFAEVECFWRWCQFAGWVAVK